jgi:hypothetical protein
MGLKRLLQAGRQLAHFWLVSVPGGMKQPEGQGRFACHSGKPEESVVDNAFLVYWWLHCRGVQL